MPTNQASERTVKSRSRSRELVYRLRQQELLSEFGLYALGCSDFHALLQRATELCAEGLETGLCKALEYVPAKNRLLVRAGVGWAAGVVGQASVGADMESPAGYALKTGEPVLSNHLEGETRFRMPKLLAAHGVRRAINVIIRGGPDAAPFGVLEADSQSEGRFSADDVAFMRSFANLLGVAIERNRAEAALEEERTRFRATFDQAAVGIAHLGPDGEWLKVNDRFCEIVGYPREELLRLTFQDITHPDDLRPDLAHLRDLGAGRIPRYAMQKRYIRKDGSIVWVRLTVGAVRRETGSVAYYVSVVEDISAEKAAEARLRESERHLRLDREFLSAILRQAPVGISIAEAPSGRSVVVNDRAVELFGHPASGENMARFETYGALHPDGRPYAVDEYPTVRALKQGEVIEREQMIYRRGDGRLTHFEISSAPVRDAAGTIVASVTVLSDIDDRLRMEQALRGIEERYRLAARATNDAIWDWELSTDHVRWNEAVSTLFGYAPEEVGPSGSWWIEHIHPEDRERVVSSIHAVIDGSGTRWTDEYRFRKADGTWADVFDRGYVVRGPDGVAVRMIGAMLDITERKRDAERLKLLAAEVDHRAKNMLALVQVILRQTRADTIQDFARAVTGRVNALARAHALLAANRWQGADLRRLIEEELAPFRAANAAWLHVAGPAFTLPANAAQALAIALHELATNAAKYGALSTPRGRLAIEWRCDMRGALALRWTESGGPAVGAPRRRGIGLDVIERTVRDQLDGDLRFDWRPDGLVCEIDLPPDRPPKRAR